MAIEPKGGRKRVLKRISKKNKSKSENQSEISSGAEIETSDAGSTVANATNHGRR